MQTGLLFRILPSPIERKVLLAFRRNAGWKSEDRSALSGAQHPAARVQWAVVEAKGMRIGIARLELAAPQFCHVSDLIVLRAYRGRGIGEWFMQRIEQHCIEQGIARVLLQPAQEARGFYEKLHFSSDPYVAGFLKKDISPLRRKLLAF
jgi:GNAT superfamily N-acetyltransferase